MTDKYIKTISYYSVTYSCTYLFSYYPYSAVVIETTFLLYRHFNSSPVSLNGSGSEGTAFNKEKKKEVADSLSSS